MGTIILILIFKFILLYFQIGVIFTIFSFLYMFALNSEKNLKIQEYLLMILLYPFVINSLLKNEQ